MSETGAGNETGTGKAKGVGMGRGAAWHPIPIRLVDEVMPTLKDTELRVLLVVVRQTLGWQEGPDPARRKERDWLTQSQLMRRTGRASGAVARAVDALVRAGLIEVSDRAGVPLTTPAERRRHLGRLYYRPSLAAAERADTGTSKSEHAKAHTTKESKYKNICKAGRTVDKPVGNPLVIRGGWTQAGADVSSSVPATSLRPQTTKRWESARNEAEWDHD